MAANRLTPKERLVYALAVLFAAVAFVWSAVYVLDQDKIWYQRIEDCQTAAHPGKECR